MSKKVSYDVSYQVCGRATTTVPDYIQTKDEAIEWLKKHWNELPLPEEASCVSGPDELDLKSDIEIWEEPFEEETNVNKWHFPEALSEEPVCVKKRDLNKKFHSLVKISTNPNGRFISYLGYGYCKETPLLYAPYRMICYFGFAVPLEDALERGIIDYETEFGDHHEARAKVYFRENLEDIYHHINDGNRAQFILSENVSMSTPDGVYEVRGDNDKFI